MSTTDKADELKALADAMGNVLIPGSQTITAKYVISPELLNRMAAAALRARAADVQARALSRCEAMQ